MRGKNLIVLTLLVVALAAFIVLVERHQPTTDELDERADRVFPGLDGDEVVSVELKNRHGLIRLERTDDEWRLVEPVEYRADAAAVRSLLRSVSGLDAERELPLSEIALADYGLDSPVLTVVLVDAEGRRFQLAVGGETPLGSRRAVRRGDDDRIVLTAGGFVSDIDREVDHWRSRDVVDVLEHQLASVEIDAGDDRIRAVRINDRWQLLEPFADLADGDQIQNVVSELNTLRVSEFLPGDADPVSLGLATPEYRLLLVRADGGDPVTVELAAPAVEDDTGTVACRRNGIDLFRVPDTIRTRLAKAPVLWRSKTVWPFTIWDVDGLRVSGPGGDIELAKIDGEDFGESWRLTDGRDGDEAEVRRRLTALADLQALDFDLLLPPTAVMGSAVVELDEDGADPVVFTFYRPLEEGGHAAVTVSARATVMGVDAATAETIVGDLDLLRSAVDEQPANDETASEDG